MYAFTRLPLRPAIYPAEAWWDRYITRASIEALPVRAGHIAQLDMLPDLHKDPFDRMLIAQYSLVKTVWK